jgi:hypothetical protein
MPDDRPRVAADPLIGDPDELGVLEARLLAVRPRERVERRGREYRPGARIDVERQPRDGWGGSYRDVRRREVFVFVERRHGSTRPLSRYVIA